MGIESSANTFSYFPTTQWSQIIAVIQNGDGPAADHALDQFCRRYRTAIYNYFRRHGSNHDEAEDLTQDFFCKRILTGWDERQGILYSARREEGRRFRSFLATSLWRFRIEKWRAANAQKAGGGVPHGEITNAENLSQVSLAESFEEFGREFDQLFAIDAIKNAAERATRSHAFLNYFIRREQAGEAVAQTEAARALDLSVGAFKTGYRAFRIRLKDELHNEVAKYAGPDPREIEEEIAYLVSLFPDSIDAKP